MMVLPATFSKSNSFDECAVWMPTMTLGKERVSQEKSLQLAERSTGSTSTYGTAVNMSVNSSVAHRFVFFQHIADYEKYFPDTGNTSGLSASYLDSSCLEAPTETRTCSRYGLSESILGYLGMQTRRSISDLTRTPWVSIQVLQEEEELETIHVDTNQGLSFKDLVSALDRISRPTEIEDIPLPFDPDDYPVV